MIVHERFRQLKGNLLQSCKMILPMLGISVAFTKNIYIYVYIYTQKKIKMLCDDTDINA